MLQSLQSTQQDLSSLRGAAMDSQTSFAIRSAIAQERKASSKRPRWPVLAGGVAATLILIGGFIAVSHNRADRRPSNASSAAYAVQAFPLQHSSANYSDTTLRSELIAAAKGDQTETTRLAPDAAAGSSNAPGALSKAAPADRGTVEQAQRCFNEKIAPSTRQPATIMRVISARYKGESVYLYFLQAPAAKPVRIELWGMSQASCTLRIFQQIRFPS